MCYGMTDTTNAKPDLVWAIIDASGEPHGPFATMISASGYAAMNGIPGPLTMVQVKNGDERTVRETIIEALNNATKGLKP